MTGENIFLLHAFVLGVFITFVYDWLRIFRRVVPHGGFAVSAEDLGFWGFCAIEVFLLMYRESNGNLRWFAVLGALAGMALYRKTLSDLFVKYVSLLFQKLLGLIGRILGIFRKPGAAAGRKIGRFSSFLKKRLTASVKMLRMVIRKQ